MLLLADIEPKQAVSTKDRLLVASLHFAALNRTALLKRRAGIHKRAGKRDT